MFHHGTLHLADIFHQKLKAEAYSTCKAWCINTDIFHQTLKAEAYSTCKACHGQTREEAKNLQIEQKTASWTQIGGEIYKSCGNRGINNMHRWLREMDAPGLKGWRLKRVTPLCSAMGHCTLLISFIYNVPGERNQHWADTIFFQPP